MTFCHQVLLPTNDIWLPWQCIPPHYATNLTSPPHLSTKYWMLAFKKCLLKSVRLNSVELTQNRVQLFHRNMPFFNFSDPYAMTLTLKRQDHTTVGQHILDVTQVHNEVVQISSPWQHTFPYYATL